MTNPDQTTDKYAELRERAESFIKQLSGEPAVVAMPFETIVELMNDLLAALAEMQGVVERLPVTKDGRPIYPGMRVFPEILNDYQIPDGPLIEDEGGVVEDYTGIRIRDTQGEYGPHYAELAIDELLTLYSTREAALAARKGE